MNLYSLPAGEDFPRVVTVVVEIPKGSRNKVEYDPHTGCFRLNRVLHSSVHYPGDYGFVPSTLAPDGDALDVLVLVTEPTFVGCVLAARPIGMLEMRDSGYLDQKVLCVPESDPRFQEMDGLEDLSQHLLREIEHFFDIYKELEGKRTASSGWRPVSDASVAILAAAAAYVAAAEHV